ncbi:MAG: hypothetical protein JWN42_2440, partial [Candidatus Angelobacter sp.]|nr:hypothetical protein [Candidatus Angelobacter sp.]
RLFLPDGSLSFSVFLCALCGKTTWSSLDRRQRLIQIGQEIFDILNTD